MAAVAGTEPGVTGDEAFMRLALAAARRAALAGEPPIGACLVRDGAVIATAANAVIAELDITAHAEVMLIREACRRGRTLDLSGTVLYSTVEPCAMCQAASHYAGIGEIVYAASLADMQALTGGELGVTVAGPAMRGGCLRTEALSLLRAWAGGRSA
ncbi:MAG: nucleoside deaminase [Gammaproteobacteria bacterium]|nr:nucleoside deaminase [Gammaproteobacteria bacterium]